MLLIHLIIILILFAGLSIFITSMKTGITPMPSSGKARRAVVSAVENTGSGPIIDLGSGWGSFVIALARRYPDRQIIGYELSIVPLYFTAFLKKILKLDNIKLRHENFLTADLSNASVLVCYLFPGGMESLKKKLLSELKNDTRIISCLFAFPSCTPSHVIRIDDMYNTPVYVYDDICNCCSH